VVTVTVNKFKWQGVGKKPHCWASQQWLAWHQRVSSRTVAWRNWNDVKRDYASASKVGNCTVFNIAGNKYRLITRILYVSQKVFVLRVMTHANYDKDVWKQECGCFDPPPRSDSR
jgi:mRNA interferase HigB